MKKLLTLIALTAIFASCGTTVDEADESVDENTNEVVAETTAEFSHLAFMIPAGFVIEDELYTENDSEYITFMVPDEEYEVTLFMKVHEYEEGFSEEDMQHTTDLGNGLSYMVDGCNALACYLIGSNEYKASVMFYIESTEEAPEDLDGIWNPSTNLTRENLEAFLRTAELTSK